MNKFNYFDKHTQSAVLKKKKKKVLRTFESNKEDTKRLKPAEYSNLELYSGGGEVYAQKTTGGAQITFKLYATIGR